MSTIEKIDNNFNPEKVNKIITLLLDTELDLTKIRTDLSVSVAESERILNLLNKINEQAKILWRSSLMASSADLPREISKRIIEDNHLSSTRDHNLVVKELNLAQHHVEFESWLNNWQYKSNSLFKVKTLFASIIHYSMKDDGELIIRPINLTVNPDVNAIMELDHMVPQNSSDPSVFNFEHSERELYVNGLGNMMPLPKPDNIQKSNAALEAAFQFYKDAGLGDHFLINEARHSVLQVLKQEKNPDLFFTERKSKLISYFKQII